MKTQFPTLYKKHTSGKISSWDISVEERNVPTIVITTGYIDGQKTTTERSVPEGVNIGKSNEKTALEYACFQANARWKKKVEEGSSPDINKLDQMPTPMLAKPFDYSSTTMPCYVQPKFNGIRCTIYRHLGDDRFLSRKLKEFTTLEFMRQEIETMFGDYSPDGEIYIHGLPLQDIVSLLKREQADTSKLKYVVYDLAIPDYPFSKRSEILTNLYKNYTSIYDAPQHIEIAPTDKAETLDDIQCLYNKWIKLGYEGAIIRNPDGQYHFNNRNSDLMKYKGFKDSEFKIIGYKVEKYFDKAHLVFRNLVIWICETPAGDVFNVRPLGTASQRETYYRDADLYIGKYLTVRYLELSKKGVPIGNPVGLAIRDYE